MSKKKILVTGSAGFIFSNFIRWALIYYKAEYDFVSIDKILQPIGIHNIYANRGHEFYVGDVCDRHFIDVVFQLQKPDVVIHGAAFSNVDDAIKQADDFVVSNILGKSSVTLLISSCVSIFPVLTSLIKSETSLFTGLSG